MKIKYGKTFEESGQWKEAFGDEESRVLGFEKWDTCECEKYNVED